jgi:hypothetical protein
MGRDFGKHWERFPEEWLQALQEGDAKRHGERFAKEAAEAERRRGQHQSLASVRMRFVREFDQAVAQREQRRQQAMTWAQERRTQKAATA